MLVDAWYMNKRLWKAAKQRGFDLSGGLPSNRQLRRIGPDGEQYWQSLGDYGATLTSEQFAEVIWPSQAGGQKRLVHSIQTRIHKLGVCQLLCVQSDGEEEAKTTFYVSSLLEASAQEIVNHLAARWDIETFFGDFKELLGSDHYQMMSDRAILRFWTLGCLAYLFLDEQRARSAQPATIGQTRQAIQTEYYNKLLAWVCQQINNGASLQQIQKQLAA